MKTKFNGILTLLLAFVVQISFAQSKTVSGTIKDATGPLPGVSVVIKGTVKGTDTDFDGKYSISTKVGDILVYSYLGYETVQRTVGNSSSINVTMKEGGVELEEIIITGYTTTTRAKAATSSTQLSASTIEDRPNGNIVQTLAGQVPGLDIATSSGQPGANSLVQLRGVNSINGNTEPLFIMDGIPINEDNFRSLNQNEIESVTVLKDAGATAIYGSRGANGVIVIKTKTGKIGSGLQVRYTGLLSYSSLQGSNYNLQNSQDALRLERLTGNGFGAGANVGSTAGAYFQNPNFDVTNNSTSPLTDAQISGYETTDWIDLFLRTSQTQNHTVTLSSGTENMSQFTSLGYFNQDGILRESNLQRFNLRNNITGNSGNFTYGTNVSINYSKNAAPTSIGTTGVNQNPFFGANLSLPYLRAEDQPTSQELAGNFFLSLAPYYNVDKLNTSTSLNEEVKIVASVNASYAITDNLTAGFLTGLDYESIVDLDAQNPVSRNQLRFNTAVDGQQSQDLRRSAAFNTTASLVWDKSFDKHTFTVGAYTEYFKAHLRTFGFTANGLNPKTFFPGDGSSFIPDNGDNDANVDTVFANILNAGLFSYFSTLDYDFDSKYGISASVRRDASYRFASTNRWATFYSVSGRWNIDQESFMEDSAFNTLKLRASYGTSGNQRISGNSYYSSPDLPFDFFGTFSGYQNQQGIVLSQLGNNTLKWETVAQLNVGVDFGVFQNRLRGSIDYYRKETTDLFQSLPVSSINGQSFVNANTGSLFNVGWDLELKYDVIRNNDMRFTINTVGNINDNFLENLPSSTGEIIGIGRNGGPLGERYEIRYAGVNPSNGNLLFLDKDGNLTENPDADTDRVWTGKNVAPEAQGSFGFDFDYKGFFLQTQFNYTIGVDFSDIDYARYIDQNNIGSFLLSNDLQRAWTPTNRITDIPSLTVSNDNFNSDRFVVDRDFVRLRFVTAGYNVPQKFLNNTGFNNLRIFVNAENLFTWTKFRGFDASSRATGLEYPTPQIVSLGVEFGL